MTLGSAMGFLIPPMIVHDSDNLDDIAYDLKTMCWGLAFIIAPVALTVVFCKYYECYLYTRTVKDLFRPYQKLQPRPEKFFLMFRPLDNLNDLFKLKGLNPPHCF